MLFILRIIWSPQIQSVGKVQSHWLLKHMVHKITTGLYKVKDRQTYVVTNLNEYDRDSFMNITGTWRWSRIHKKCPIDKVKE
jgi:hypothetical protein